MIPSVYYTRQEMLLRPDELCWPTHVVGVGAVGSYVTLLLAKLGMADLHIYDLDRVMPENVGNQLYGPADIDIHKVHALTAHVEALTGIRPNPHPQRVEMQRFEGIVILAVDSMIDRRNIFQRCIRGRSAVRWMLDVRLGFLRGATGTETGLLFALRPIDQAECEEYERSLYEDSTALPLDCRAAGISYASVLAAGKVARRIKQITRGEPFPLLERILP